MSAFLDPASSSVAALVAAVLMVASGLGKHRLEWKPRRPPRRRRPKD